MKIDKIVSETISQIETLEDLKQRHIQEIEDEQEQEYCQKVVYIETVWRGTFSLPKELSNEDFNPRCFKGTKKAYDLIMAKHFSSDTYGKIIGCHVFNTRDEYLGINRR